MPPMLVSATQTNITVEWAETPHCTCYYLDRATPPEMPEFRLNKQQSARLRQPLPCSPTGPARLPTLTNGTFVRPQEVPAGSEHPGGGEWPEWIPVYCGQARSFQVQGLMPGRRYLFRIRTVVSKSPLPPSSPQLASLPAVFATLPSIPNPPSTPLLEEATSTSLKVKWSPPLEAGGMPVLEYRLDVNPPPTSREGEKALVMLEDGYAVVYEGEDTSARVNRLQPGGSYFFRCQ
eukprot:jgi/Mesen1/8196/ME000442S07475